jgi:hypothetical protein
VNKLRIVIAIVLTFLMLYIARTNSKGRPEHVIHTDNGIPFELVTVPKAIEHDKVSMVVAVGNVPDSGVSVRFRFTEDETLPLTDFSTLIMEPSEKWPSEIGRSYWTEIEAGPKGGRLRYFFDVADSGGNQIARLTYHEDEPFNFKYFGTVPVIILTLHILFMFATVFCISMVMVQAFGVWRDGEAATMMSFLMWATVACFIGAIPFGIPMNWYAFGSTWEAVPFGHDATDNKTQLLFVSLLFATLAGLGSLRRGRGGRDLISPRNLAWLGFGSFAVMLFIYLIPHSIQFSPLFTHIFSWSWIGIVVAAYVYAFTRSKKAARE